MIYLDNAATSFPKAPGVAEAVASSISELPGSAGRSSHAYALEANELLYDTRLELAAFLGLPAAERLVFTKNATEALNIAILGLLGQGSRVVASCLEHNAVMRPLRFLEASRGLRIDTFPCTPSGLPDLDALEDLLAGQGRRPDLLISVAASNVSGAMLPLASIASLARRHGVPLLLDASQLAGHLPVDFGGLGIDYLAFPGHKGLLGPAGTGGLWMAPGSRLPSPLMMGGTGSRSESDFQPDFIPDSFESGTHNLAAIAGLKASLAWLSALGLKEVERREAAISGRLSAGLSSLKGFSLLGPGPQEKRLPVISCLSDACPEAELARELDRRGIAIRMGLHCAPAAHRSLGSFQRGGSLRFSPGLFTTEAEVDACLGCLEEML